MFGLLDYWVGRCDYSAIGSVARRGSNDVDSPCEGSEQRCGSPWVLCRCRKGDMHHFEKQEHLE